MGLTRQPADPFTVALVAEIPKLRRACVSLVRGGHALGADDLLQATLLKALESRDGFTLGTNMGAWLHTIARRHLYTEARARRNTRPHASIDDTPGEVSRQLQTPAAAEHRLAVRDCAAVLAKAPAGMWDAFLNIRLRGLTHEQHSAATGIPEGTIKSRLFRIDEKLRKAAGA